MKRLLLSKRNYNNTCTYNSNEKLKFREYCLENLEKVKNINLPEVSKESIYEAVLIEFRIFPHLEFIIRNNISKLGKEWSYTIVCGNLNFDFMTTMCSSISENIKIIKLDYGNIDVIKYSEILTSVDFWNLFKGEKILIHQEDSLIFRDNIKEFIQWDYIGAPWPKYDKVNLKHVGNGGFSLRSKQCMIDVILKDNKTLSFHPEDIYFTRKMIELNIGNIADYDTASLFSLEGIANENSCGGHCFWLYNKDWRKLINL
jgi:hypothetical protein